MKDLPRTLLKDDFVEGFSRTARLALFVTGYLILGAILLSLLTPEQRIFAAIVDGTVLRMFPFAAALIVSIGIAGGFANSNAIHRPKASYGRPGRTQLAK